MKPLIIVLALLVAVAGVGGWYWQHHSKPAVSFKTAEVKHGELLATISATGTIEPEEVVDVGAQVAGLIYKFGTDANGKMIDYGSPIEQGTVLAEIDKSLYQADVDQANAQLAQARATLQHDEADIGRLQALLDQAGNDWERAKKIGPSDALSRNDYDMYKANFATAQANLKVGMAAIEQAKAQVAQAQSTLDRANRNVAYCTIASPVKGVIIDRRVNIGQTVVSSLSAPSLFLIAKDLHKMQLWVAVNEADVGNIHAGQDVTFTVDAFPGELFHGTVNKVRLNATMTQNVVTYTVEVNTDNSSGTLLPYLTANVQFVVKKDEDVQLVPNAALRWYPEPQEVAPEVRAQFIAADEQGATPAAPKAGEGEGKAQKKQKRAADVDKTGIVWVQDGQWVKPISVTVGPTDGTSTEISSADLKDGSQVIVAEVHADDASAQTTNPFAPQMFRRNQKKGK